MYDGELYAWRNLMEQGTRCLRNEQYLKAENYLIQGLLKAYELTVPEILAFTLRLLATVRVHLGNLEYAEEGFKDALRICDELQNTKGMSEALAGLASISVKRGRFQDAMEKYEQAIAIYPKTSPQLRFGMLYADLGQVYTALEEWTKAKEAYSRAIELCRLHGSQKGEAELAVLSGELYFRLEHKKEAIEELKRACQIFIQIEDMVSLSTTLQYMALLYFDQNEMLCAFECQQRAVAISLSFDTGEMFSESCYFLGKILQNLDWLQEAINYLKLSIDFYSERNLGMALRYQSLASLFFLSFDLNKSEVYYLKALSLFEQLTDRQRIGEVYEALARLKAIGEQEESVLKIQDRADDRTTLHGDLTLEALIRLAEFYDNRRNYRDALECYWKALKKARDMDASTEWIEGRVQRVSKSIRGKK